MKLLSFNTILMSLFLMWKDGKRLINFFFLNKPTSGVELRAPYTSKKLKYSLLTIKLLYIGFIVITTLTQAFAAEKLYGSKAPKPPLYGIYYTEEFVRNNETVAPLATDSTRWKRIIISSTRFASVQLMNDSTEWYSLKVDTLAKRFIINPPSDTLVKSVFNYSVKAPYLELTSDSMRIKLKRFDEKKFLLMNRGFHWVNEYPFNR